jgi:hypothetical protein
MKYSFSLTPKVDVRAKVERLEEVIKHFPQTVCPVRNLFAPGVYAREMTVPKDVTATGAVHKTEHMAFIDGHCILTTDEGPKEFRGHHVIVSKPGAKRAIYAIEETIVTTIHPTNETDVDKLCELLTESKADELLGGSNNKQLLAQAGVEVIV